MKYTTTDTALTSIANAIRAKGETSNPLTFPDGFVSAIEAIPTGGGGGGGSIYDDVVFYDDLANDCNGGVVASYSAADFAQLTAMPANPDHSTFTTHGISIPMTSQGWNWSLADAKAYVADYGKLNIGQMYKPIDGKSHWICYVPLDAPVERWNTKIQISVSGGSVNWQIDDGSTSTASEDISVTFPSAGWHDVKISAPSGVTYYPYYFSSSKSNELTGKIQKTIQVFLGSGVTSIGLYAFRQYINLTSITIPYGVTSIDNSVFINCYNLTSITIPDRVINIGSSAFQTCGSLTSITIPYSVTSIGNNAFQNCYSLKTITIPNSATSIGNNVFYYCYSLKSITIPDSVTSIGSNAFAYCYSLTSITIPDSVTSIDSNAFQNCCSLKNIIIERSTPPTLSNVNAFTNLMSDYSIIVPAGSLSSYTSASPWSGTPSSQIVEASA